MAEAIATNDLLTLKLAQEKLASARRQVVIEEQGLEILRLNFSIHYGLRPGDRLDSTTGEVTRRPSVDAAPLDPARP